MAGDFTKTDVSPSGEQALDGVRLGSLGEMIAERKLESEGYKIAGRNVRIRGGELDIVAEDGETLVFVEVKTRVRSGTFKPRDNVTRGKSFQIKSLSEAFVKKHRKYKNSHIRFDVVEVILDPETLAPAEVTLHKRFFD